jgi:O-antigen ligase
VAIKYTDNMLKSVAAALAIVVNGFISVIFFEKDNHRMLTPSFVFGAVLVMVAVVLYTFKDNVEPKRETAQVSKKHS